MRRFLLASFCFSLLFSGILLFGYNYRLIVVLYHLLVMGAVIGSFATFLFLLAVLVKTKPLQNILVTGFAAIFFSLFLFFYVLVLGSNLFWHKTITLAILKNYTASFNDLFSILPLQKGIVIGLVLVYLLLNGLLVFFIKPDADKIIGATLRPPLNSRKKWMVGAGLLLALLLLLYRPFLQMKRIMHMAEEPFLQFTLGAMWGERNDIAFDKLRYQNGLSDKPCIDSIQDSPSEHTTVIVLVDGLRADHLPMYGYERNTAPFLDSLYQEKKLLAVNHAFSTSTNTIGGIAGLFFSKDWLEFGFNGLSLMKFFKKAGFKTYAFLTGFHRDWYGLSALYRESCDVYYESSENPDIKNDDDLITLEKINVSPFQKKSFVFIHLLSVHLIGKKNEAFKQYLPDKIGFGVDKKTALVNNYDNGIRQSDFVIRSIFDKLKREQLLPNATVYILADHGELFGENNTWGHGGDINEHLLSVPLLIYDEQSQWYQNLEAATLKDVAPTIADRIGTPVPACWEGRSLHRPPNDFTVAVASAEECLLPYGTLIRKDSAIKLNIMNMQMGIEKTVYKKGNSWTMVP